MNESWRKWTTPTSEGEVAQRREAVLLSVLAGMVLLSAVTVVVQLVSMAVNRDATVLAWIALNVTVGGGFAVLLIRARRGARRFAAVALIAILGGLALLLLITDGTHEPMWSMLSAFAVVLATILLGGRGGLMTLAIGALAVIPVVAADDAGEVPSAVELVLLLAVLTLVCRAYTRDVLMTVDEQLARGSGESPLRQLRTRDLTMREVEVVQLIAEGESNDAIAGRLFVSPRTVHSHVSNAMRKCGCANRTELGVLAVREGLVPLDATSPPPLPARA